MPKSSSIRSSVLVEHRLVTDRQTDTGPWLVPRIHKINLIKELLSVKFHKGQISLFCESEVDFMIWFLCTS